MEKELKEKLLNADVMPMCKEELQNMVSDLLSGKEKESSMHFEWWMEARRKSEALEEETERMSRRLDMATDIIKDLLRKA